MSPLTALRLYILGENAREVILRAVPSVNRIRRYVVGDIIFGAVVTGLSSFSRLCVAYILCFLWGEDGRQVGRS